jgi:porin
MTKTRSSKTHVTLSAAAFLLASAGLAAAEDGDLLHRERLSGDWGGVRTNLEEAGLSFQVVGTGFLDGVPSGDGEGGPDLGGHAYAALNFDGTRAGFIKGFSFDLAFEGHDGDTVNDRTGTILPPNFAMNALRRGDGVGGITVIKLAQHLTKDFSVYAGKTVPLYGFQNEFIDGMGRTKFENTAFTAKPVVGGAIAYSAWAAGFNWNLVPSKGLHDRGAWLKFYVQDTNFTGDRLGLDTLFDNGVNIFTEIDFPTTFFGLPGNHVLSFVWSNAERTSLDIHQAITLPGGGIVPGTEDSTWNVYYAVDQFLYVNPDDPERGWGLFGKVEFSDGNPNPLDVVAAAGFGGIGPFDGRPRDRWGIGGYVAEVSDTLKDSLAPAVDLDTEWGTEVFYSAALTPAVALGVNGQFLRGAVSRDWESVVGLRLNVNF